MGLFSHPDVIVAGAGIIGLSAGLELRRRGFRVLVVERETAMRAASWAAGGMLAAGDSGNPPALLPLALCSAALYPEYLSAIEQASGMAVPVRSRRTLEQIEQGGARVASLDVRALVPGFAGREEEFAWLEEDSVDPRDLCRALPAAFANLGGELREHMGIAAVAPCGSSVAVHMESGECLSAAHFVNCCGAWAAELAPDYIPVEPVKGQALTVALAPDRMRCVVRTPEFYAIPRGDGRVMVGATVEHVGFDTTVQPESTAQLLQTAARTLPELARARILEAWAGLRPGTPDTLPVLGAGAVRNCWYATGHYRNGILLAPVTARLLGQMIENQPVDVDLWAFRPERFANAERRASAHPVARLDAEKTVAR